MNITISTAAAKRPISLREAKQHLQVEHDADDQYIDGLIRTATTVAEEYMGRALIQQTITLEIDAHEAYSPLTLPRAPFSSLTSFSYYDSAGNSTAVDSSVYYVSGTDPATLVAYDGGWQIQRRRKSHEIVYVAGYGANPSSVPYPIRHAIKVMVADMWNNQESMKLESRSSSFPTELPMGAFNLLRPYRLSVL